MKKQRDDKGKFIKGHNANQKLDYEDIRIKLEKYIEETNIPIIAEFCYSYNNLGLNSKSIYSINDISIKELIKKAMDKKAAGLEQGSLTGNFNPTASIFLLKQMGYSDKIEVQAETKQIDMSKLSIEELKQFRQLQLKISEG